MTVIFTKKFLYLFLHAPLTDITTHILLLFHKDEFHDSHNDKTKSLDTRQIKTSTPIKGHQRHASTGKTVFIIVMNSVIQITYTYKLVYLSVVNADLLLNLTIYQKRPHLSILTTSV